MRRTRQDVMANNSIHQLTKDILTTASRHDPVDVVMDVKLALEVLENELEDLLGDFEKDMVITPLVKTIPVGE